MELYPDILEVQRSVGSGEDIHRAGQQLEALDDEDLFLLQLTDIEFVENLLKRYNEIQVSRDHIDIFKQHLLHRSDSWFVGVGDVGLIYLTNIVPAFAATLQVLFWDRKFGKNRRSLVQRVLATAFKEFALTRVQATVPASNTRLAETELPKIGFTREGVLRKAWRAKNGDEDIIILGLLKEEVQWPTVEHLTISLAQAT